MTVVELEEGIFVKANGACIYSIAKRKKSTMETTTKHTPEGKDKKLYKAEMSPAQGGPTSFYTKAVKI